MGNTGERSGSGTVLVGVDESENSERAFEVALAIAERRDWDLLLVQAYSTLSLPYAYDAGLIEQYRRQSEQRAQSVLDRLAAKAREAGATVSSRVEEHEPVGLLVAESRSARLAVVGKRGLNRFAGRFLGSVSGALAAHAHCPTLVVPDRGDPVDGSRLIAPSQERPEREAAEDEPARLLDESEPIAPAREFENVENALNFDDEVVVGIDHGDAAAGVALQAAEYAEHLGKPLTLVTAEPLTGVYFYPNAAMYAERIPKIRKKFAEHLAEIAEQVTEKHASVPVRWRFFDSSPAGVLSEAARTASLVVVGTRGHGGFTGLLLGSVSRTVLNRSVCPVLVVPTKKRR